MLFLRILIALGVSELGFGLGNNHEWLLSLDSVAEQGYNDLVAKLDVNNSGDVSKFDDIVKGYLSDLMVMFRGKIVQLYKIHSCPDQQCFNSDVQSQSKLKLSIQSNLIYLFIEHLVKCLQVL